MAHSESAVFRPYTYIYIYIYRRHTSAYNFYTVLYQSDAAIFTNHQQNPFFVDLNTLKREYCDLTDMFSVRNYFIKSDVTMIKTILIFGN